MDVEAAFSRLPETHAAALRLRARGFDDDAIAAALGLEPKAVEPLLLIAEAKLEALTGRSGEAGEDVSPMSERGERRVRDLPDARQTT
jgi:DNA-directed RNA polymerase specialized sigma24 family protein